MTEEEQIDIIIDILLDEVKTARAEAVKEFAEIIVADYPEMEYYLNDLVKEFTGEEEND